jgi:hypothetical protein
LKYAIQNIDNRLIYTAFNEIKKMKEYSKEIKKKIVPVGQIKSKVDVLGKMKK